MTPSTVHTMLKDFMKRLASIGGILHRNHQISTRLRIFGMSFRGMIKPTTKQELIDGILTFWAQVDDKKCCKYIGHLKKVILKVIECKGEATGY